MVRNSSSFGGNDGLPAGNYRVTATKLILKDKFQERYDRQVKRAAAEAEPGE
ncbi:MAG: hypothetical protein HN985_05150, partial [Planctomycetaceae bacterium]|nr:hypothetical protein [Planctomycetaceae bacterium]MBT7729217.1 hypothetical protein [Planctomycetaceae bacterium]